MFHIVVIVSVITLCNGEPPSYHEPHKSLPLKPDHAISSQSYMREDVPLSYSFKAIHAYTPAQPQPQYRKSYNYVHQYPASVQQFNAPAQHIQNAPAQQNPHIAEKDHGPYTKIIAYPLQHSIMEEDTKEQLIKHHVVPKRFPFSLIPPFRFASIPVSAPQFQKAFNIEYSRNHAPAQESQAHDYGIHKHPAPALEMHLENTNSHAILDTTRKLYFLRHPAAYAKNLKLTTATLRKNIFRNHPGFQIKNINIPQYTNRYLKYDDPDTAEFLTGNFPKKAFPTHTQAIFKKVDTAMEKAPSAKMYPTNQSKNH